MDRPVQVSLDPEQRRRARQRAAERGLTLSSYIARLIDDDLVVAWVHERGAPRLVPIEVDLPSDHEGTYIGEAVAARMNQPPERGT
jgi:hypothetical protein